MFTPRDRENESNFDLTMDSISTSIFKQILLLLRLDEKMKCICIILNDIAFLFAFIRRYEHSLMIVSEAVADPGLAMVHVEGGGYLLSRREPNPVLQ